MDARSEGWGVYELEAVGAHRQQEWGGWGGQGVQSEGNFMPVTNLPKLAIKQKRKVT
jgi:hypothetical protein